MNYHCLIVDDEPLARKLVREYLDQISDFTSIGECQDAMEAQQYLLKQKVDVLFLDIAMPQLTGMQFLKSLTKAPLVIFTTAYAEYAVEAFEVNAFDYLVKPITFERFVQSINKVRSFYNQKIDEQHTVHTWINIKEGRRVYHVNTADIVYLQAYGDYVRIFTKDGTLMTKERLNVLKDQLPDIFIQVHRSYIINRQAVKFVEGNQVQVESFKIPVSDSFRDELLDLFK
ncbi:MAG: response regulator transcription factor [Saprospiraceae bacterium]|nr:response regulator transcription factor [Saprospiraceae bacterium]